MLRAASQGAWKHHAKVDMVGILYGRGTCDTRLSNAHSANHTLRLISTSNGESPRGDPSLWSPKVCAARIVSPILTQTTRASSFVRSATRYKLYGWDVEDFYGRIDAPEGAFEASWASGSSPILPFPGGSPCMGCACRLMPKPPVHRQLASEVWMTEKVEWSGGRPFRRASTIVRSMCYWIGEGR